MAERVYQRKFGLGLDGTPRFLDVEAKITSLNFDNQFYGLRRMIENRSMWQAKPEGKPLYLDLRGEVTGRKMASSGWEKEEPIKKEEVGQLSRIPALILVTQSVNFGTGENLDKIDIALKLLGNSLQKNASPVFVVEYKGKDLAKEPRLDLMKQWGLISTNVLIRRGHQRMIWEGRKEKQREVKGVDLIQGAKEKGNYLHKMAVEVNKAYQEAGYRVVNWNEIHQLLLNSKNPLSDIEKLKNGWGVRLEANCGCVFNVNLYGEMVNYHSCGDSLCSVWEQVHQGSLKNEKENRKYQLHQFEIVNKSGCLGCGGDIVRYVVEEKHGKEKSKILINTYCSSCSKEIKVEEKWVNNQDIIWD